ncbi:hypothetical protein MTR67_017042 [Solanum verrucosum]|uniref:Uncharacterized protein n=1 Tax=Solanum verrucosum TaxID=315347 RepID=A0AAF0QIZ2_SOLVR|nr:hypothetical protein MTR67_017042 [Solanum verrucosum]
MIKKNKNYRQQLRAETISDRPATAALLPLILAAVEGKVLGVKAEVRFEVYGFRGGKFNGHNTYKRDLRTKISKNCTELASLRIPWIRKARILHCSGCKMLRR